MDKINNNSKALYLKVKEAIEKKIEKKVYQPGDRLDSEAELSKKFGVSRATLREALRILEKEGKIRRRQGVGTFITEKALLFKSGIEELNSITKTIEAMGLKAGTIDVNVKIKEDKLHLINEFSLKENKNIVFMERTRTADGKPVAYCKDYIPEALLTKQEIASSGFESLFNLLEEKKDLHITYAVTDIVAIKSDKFLGSKLNMNEIKPLLLLKQMHYNDLDKPVLYSENYFKTDKFEFHVVRNRKY